MIEINISRHFEYMYSYLGLLLTVFFFCHFLVMFPFKCMTYHNSAQLGGTSFPGALVSSIKCTIIDLFGPYQLEVHLIIRINQLWLVRNHTKQATTRSYSFCWTWNKSQSICFRNNTARWHACFCVHTSHLEHHWRNFSLRGPASYFHLRFFLLF